jgi:beta-lactamase superfamily II metal-dependent hydrolase
MSGFLFAVVMAVSPAVAQELIVTLLDVGQGDSILLETPQGSIILVDAGLARSKTTSQLQSLGVDHIDLVVATHPHADHVGGMAEVLTEIPTDRFWYSGMDHDTKTWARVLAVLDAQGLKPEAVHVGHTLDLDGVVIQVIWPDEQLLRNTRSDLNANSVVLRVDYGQDCLLLTGDAEEVTEQRLVQQGLATCDVLKVAHHGSRHSTSKPFMAALQPEIALISVSHDNRYGHPGEETMTRLVESQVLIYRTDLTGIIQLRSNGNGWRVTDGLLWDAPVDPELVVIPPPPVVDEAPPPSTQEPHRGWLRRLIERHRAP